MALAVEIAVADPGSCPVASASSTAGTSVTSVDRASVAGDGPVTEQFAAPADAAIDEAEGIESVGTVDADAIYRFERDADEACVCERIETIAGPATDVRAEDGTLVVRATVADAETVQAVVASLRERFDGVGVRSLVHLTDATDVAGGLADDALFTERQREVLDAAFEMGYFDYPKGANAGEVAEALDISRSTLAEHLAAAQQKLLGSVLGEKRE